MSNNFTFFYNVFYAICVLKSFNSHISVVVCSFFEFGTVSKWCMKEWVKFEKWHQTNPEVFFPHQHWSWFNPLPHNHNISRPCIRNLLKTLWEKEKMLATSIFSFSHNIFYPSQDKFPFLSHIYFVICKSFQFGQGQNSVIW